MVEPTERRQIEADDRAPHGREFEVFLRSDSADPMRHAGSVRAVDIDGAYDIATRLFAWYTEDLWLCPSASVTRYTTHELAEEAITVDRSTEPEEARNSEWS